MTTYTGTTGDDVLVSTNTGTTSDTMNGLGGDDVLVAGSGIANDTLDGGIGQDAMFGGLGNDTYFVDNANDTVNENPGEGTADTVITTVSFSLANFDNVENITAKLGAGAINLGGNDGDNTLDGSIDTSANVLTGGLGNDTYVVGTGDTIVENVGEGTDTIKAGITVNLSSYANIENATLTGTSALNLTGTTATNVLTGNTGINIIDDGGAGSADTMIGGGGNDTFHVNNTADVVSGGSGVELVQSSVSYTLGASSALDKLTLTGSGNIDGTGDTLVNVITGNTGNNTLDGGAGADTMIGGGGNDTYLVDNVGDVVTGGAGIDTIIATLTTGLYSISSKTTIENVTLGGTANTSATGNTLVNIITGNSGNNTLDGGTGADTLIGGGGNDTYLVDNAGDVVTGGAGTDTVSSATISISLAGFTSVENATVTGSAALNLTGTTAANTLTGNTGANVLSDGGVGASDHLVGLAGNDTYIVNNAGDVITEAASGGTDTVQFTGTNGQTYDLGVSAANVENLSLMGGANTNATGTSGNNVLLGNAGNNTLDGGTGGNDVLKGGAGDDTYVINGTTDICVELNGGGTDTVIFNGTTGSYTLSSFLDNLVLGGSSNVNGNGNTLNNVIEGNAGNNIMNGSSGTDTVSYQNAASGVTVSLAVTTIQTTGGAGNDTLTNFENLTGSTFADTLTGSVGNNVIDGGGGNDTLVGNGGIDTVSFASSSVGVSVDLTQQGSSQVTGNGSVTMSGFVNLTGSSHDDTLKGDSASNTIDGGAGTDTIDYSAAASSMSISLLSGSASGLGQGTDTLLNIENAIGSTSDDVMFAATTGSVLDGNGSATVAGDLLFGNSGNDTFIVYTANDSAIGNGGTDTLESGLISLDLTDGAHYSGIHNATLLGSGNLDILGDNASDVLTGNAGNNTLTGGVGNDTLDGGGAGSDSLLGGLGNDTYIIHTGTEVVSDSGGADNATSSEVSINLSSYTGIEDASLTGSLALDLTGTAGDNVLTGNSGNNILDGNGSTSGDTLVGGGGTDTFVVHTANDHADNTGGSASSILESGSISLNLADAHYTSLDNATLTGSTALNLDGNANANVLIGNAGDNVIDGHGGLDALTGGAGTDTFAITAAPGGGNLATVSDFDATASTGDVLDISAILTGYTSGSLTGFVEFVTSGSDTQVSIDNSGTGTSYTLVAVLSNVTGLDGTEDALAAANTLVV